MLVDPMAEKKEKQQVHKSKHNGWAFPEMAWPDNGEIFERNQRSSVCRNS